MKIYTKTGDKGKTRLIGGCLVAKSDLRIDAYGSVDELNSFLGVIIAEISSSPKLSSLKKQLLRIQNELFNIGSLYACEKVELLQKLPAITDKHIHQLETEIDQMTSPLSELREFILPGGDKISALLHYARTVCRRAERRSVQLFDNHPEAEQGMVYLNRLSDFLFTAARFANLQAGVKDQAWEKDAP